MPVYYMTVVAKRVKDKNGKYRYEEVERRLGPEVPDMTEDEYYDEMARLLWPIIKPGLLASKKKPDDTPPAA